ncbi:hypothetical protein KPSA3_04307 [Pseudomonas syringae pv. actinidiae]|uniref:Uncharacterized protein n=1 Tax=Pseudomonas syringae pv. actinidiae TaxID=103796 RepID=A0AAN4Q6W5_PSESF|nr:hypothetical protein KPSA3_04307 [Pseudomonas syringae pv. actinidiae]
MKAQGTANSAHLGNIHGMENELMTLMRASETC